MTLDQARKVDQYECSGGCGRQLEVSRGVDFPEPPQCSCGGVYARLPEATVDIREWFQRRYGQYMPHGARRAEVYRDLGISMPVDDSAEGDDFA